MDETRNKQYWYACYTRGRHEKQVEILLREREIESYLPLVRARRQWKDRVKLVDWPLFPSYVFGRFAMDDLSRVLATRGVVGVIRVGDRPVALSEDEIENVRRFAAALGSAGVEPEPEPLVEKGLRVRICEGPFTGVEGVVAETSRGRRVLVGVRGIGQGFAVDVDVRCLKPVYDTDTDTGSVRSSAA